MTLMLLLCVGVILLVQIKRGDEPGCLGSTGCSRSLCEPADGRPRRSQRGATSLREEAEEEEEEETK